MYQVRKQLHYDWDEWEALPWWQQRAYYEMLVEEHQGSQQGPAHLQPVDELPPSLRRFEVTPDGLPTDGNDLAGFGLNVEVVG